MPVNLSFTTLDFYMKMRLDIEFNQKSPTKPVKQFEKIIFIKFLMYLANSYRSNDRDRSER
jgi:hypothetical protein